MENVCKVNKYIITYTFLTTYLHHYSLGTRFNEWLKIHIYNFNDFVFLSVSVLHTLSCCCFSLWLDASHLHTNMGERHRQREREKLCPHPPLPPRSLSLFFPRILWGTGRASSPPLSLEHLIPEFSPTAECVRVCEAAGTSQAESWCQRNGNHSHGNTTRNTTTTATQPATQQHNNYSNTATTATQPTTQQLQQHSNTTSNIYMSLSNYVCYLWCVLSVNCCIQCMFKMWILVRPAVLKDRADGILK